MAFLSHLASARLERFVLSFGYSDIYVILDDSGTRFLKPGTSAAWISHGPGSSRFTP
jgi:hypothetical protein